MGLSPRPPAFRNIWRNCATDEAVYGFWDGTFYLYSYPGAANDAASVVRDDPHGTYYNIFYRLPPPGPYSKISGAPSGFKLIYSYPPYAGIPVCNCDGPLEPAYQLSELVWVLGPSDFGSSGSGTAGNATVTAPPNGFVGFGASLIALTWTVPASLNLHAKITLAGAQFTADVALQTQSTTLAFATGANGVLVDNDIVLPNGCWKLQLDVFTAVSATPYTATLVLTLI